MWSRILESEENGFPILSLTQNQHIEVPFVSEKKTNSNCLKVHVCIKDSQFLFYSDDTNCYSSSASYLPSSNAYPLLLPPPSSNVNTRYLVRGSSPSILWHQICFKPLDFLFQRLLSMENYVYMTDETSAAVIESKHCEITTAKEKFYPSLYCVGLQNNSAYLEPFSHL